MEQQHAPTALVENPFGPMRPVQDGALREAVIQREIAEVQAAVVMAKRFPRDPIQAMDRILQAFTRPSLCAESDGRTPALYEYARGGQEISGLSIRSAEILAQHWGNILCGVSEVARNLGESECLAYAWDLETNFRDERRFVVKHQRDTRRGRYVLTDERDIYETIANQGSRRKRACLLAVIPGDVQEAARKQIEVTLTTTIQLTPERLQAMLETFASYNVTKEMLETRIQRRLESITPALFLQLGKIAASLRDRMSTPRDWFEVPDEAPAAGQQVGERITAQMADRRKKAATPVSPRGPAQASAAPAPAASGAPPPAEAAGGVQVSEDLRRELVERLEDRLLAERRTHGGDLPPPWDEWERELDQLRTLPLDSPVTTGRLSRLADWLEIEEGSDGRHDAL